MNLEKPIFGAHLLIFMRFDVFAPSRKEDYRLFFFGFLVLQKGDAFRAVFRVNAHNRLEVRTPSTLCIV